MLSLPSKCSPTITRQPARVPRQQVLSICRQRLAPVHRVIAIDHALVLKGEDLVEVGPVRANKGRTGLCRLHCKLAIEFVDVALAEESGLACAKVRIPWRRNSCGKRPCQV